MPRKTIAELQRMKERGQKICTGVVHEAGMTRIFERAGVDMLSVDDSLGRALLNYPNSDDYPVDDMLVFARAVCRTAESAVALNTNRFHTWVHYYQVGQYDEMHCHNQD